MSECLIMDKVEGCESPKITDFFPCSPVKGSLLSVSTSKSNPRLEDILPTPETSPVKDKSEIESNVTRTETPEPLVKCKLETLSDSSNEKLATRLVDDIPVETTGKENITANTPDVTENKDVIKNKWPGSKKGRKRRRRPKKTDSGTNSSRSQSQDTPTSTPEAKPKSQRKKKSDPAANNHVLTDYFPVRRSGRQCVSNIKKDEENRIEEAVLTGRETGLKVVEFEEKGRGVVATQDFRRGGFVVEYAGDLIDLTTAKERELEYSERPDKFGCYMYYFTHKKKNYCVDATLESGRLGRLLNHSKKGNCHTKLTEVKGIPHLILVASRDIRNGEELVYYYGDRSKSSIEAHPWLKC